MRCERGRHVVVPLRALGIGKALIELGFCFACIASPFFPLAVSAEGGEGGVQIVVPPPTVRVDDAFPIYRVKHTCDGVVNQPARRIRGGRTGRVTIIRN